MFHPITEWLGDLDEGVDAFFHAFGVVIGPAGGIAPAKDATLHFLMAALEVDHELGVDILEHVLVPQVEVLEVAGEAVEDVHAGHVQNVFAEQLDHEFGVHELTLVLDLLDLGGDGAAFGHLGAQQLAGRVVVHLVMLLDQLALRALLFSIINSIYN